MAEYERMLIVVRTYPDLSTKYEETVCTGAITESGHWRRLYPVPLRYLAEDKQYRIWNVIRVRVQENLNDNRIESRRPELTSLHVDRRLEKDDSRREWIESSQTFTSIKQMVDAGRSIGPVQATRVLEFVAEARPAQWSKKEQAVLNQSRMFGARLDLEKVPYRFRLRWVDGDGQEQLSTFRSWEVCQTWRSWRRRYGEDAVIEKMRMQWLDNVLADGQEIRLFMGNLSDPKLRQHFHVTGTYSNNKASISGNLFNPS